MFNVFNFVDIGRNLIDQIVDVVTNIVDVALQPIAAQQAVLLENTNTETKEKAVSEATVSEYDRFFEFVCKGNYHILRPVSDRHYVVAALLKNLIMDMNDVIEAKSQLFQESNDVVGKLNWIQEVEDLQPLMVSC